MAPKKATSKRKTHEEFVKAYKAAIDGGLTMVEFRKSIGLSALTISKRIKLYKKAGVKLPKLSNEAKIDVAALNKILGVK